MTLPSPGADRAAVVTGASSGIGVEFARDLVARGHQVVLVARTESKLAELAEELGDQAHVLPADLSDRSARAGLLDRITALGLVPDILINNAGLSTLGPVHRSDPDAELRMVEVDVLAVVDLCSRFLPGMVERGCGAVLNVASTAAFQPLPGQAGYGAGKVFVLSYTQSLSAELKGTGVSATVLCPGPVDTGFGAAAGFTKEQADEALPAFMWIPADRVARTALDGLDSGKLVVIPGVGNKVGAAFSKLAPRRLLLPILAKQHPGLP
ncbi:SDR family oxidoreductase [Nocardioides marmoriginsengisoli]|uniref:SDR family oxidoreductase n=1 Tax=Nocardioides marmoriginsengisoli TaxID=661483 RepID=A0A3N0CHV6_9ACTN|nr:SDR family oxidoreductase [Nocardioides marmoriginsengisoli]RNL63005.1 SDR family oxidoreductase [Nocardioides marmoriginsengisoli]